MNMKKQIKVSSSMIFVLILLGLVASLSSFNISNVKAQTTSIETPTSGATNTIPAEIDTNAVLEQLKTFYGVPADFLVSIEPIQQIDLTMLGIFIASPGNKGNSGPIAHYFIATQTGDVVTVSPEYTTSFSQAMDILHVKGVITQDLFAILGNASDSITMLGNGTAQLGFPWALNTNGTLTQGPHGDGFQPNPNELSALDLVPADSRVGAARDGFAQQIICSAYSPLSSWIIVTHADGWRTSYYHVVNAQVSTSGRQVNRGEYLGDLAGNSTDALRCGGGWSGPHEHFAILYNGSQINITGTDIGGWTIGGSGAGGTLTRISDGTIKYVQGIIYNDGVIGSGDTTPPTTSIALTGTVGENGWYRSAVQVTLSAIDNSGGSGVGQLQYKIDSGTWQTYSTSFSVGGNAVHAVYYKSVDLKGNWETEKSTAVKIDSVVPTGSLAIQNGSPQTYSSSVSLNTQGNDALSGIASVHFRDMGQTAWSGWVTVGSTLWQLIGFQGQTASVEAQFKDNAGNLSAVVSDSTVLNFYPVRPTSSLYKLQSSTFGAVGMNANSSLYTLHGTAGQSSMVGAMTSTNYRLNSGYWAMTPKPSTQIFTSIGAHDGWILESSETSGMGSSTMNNIDATLNLGDDIAKKQYSIVLSFNTASLPDMAGITTMTLRFKQQSIVGGGNPVATFQGFMTDIKNGFFGTFAALQSPDFQTAADATYGPFSPVPVSGVYYINLSAGKGNINKLATNGGLTQIRLRFKLDDNNDAVANGLNLYSGDTPTAADRPQLVITYYVP